MSRSVVAMLVLFFMIASCITMAKPALASANVATDSWASKTSMQVARGGLGVAVVKGKIYAIGGSTESGKWPVTNEFVSTNEEYDPETDTWTYKKPMPTPRYCFGIAVYENKIYCIGGRTDDGVTGANEVYNPETDTWETKEPMPTVRVGLEANVVNGKIYLIGGSQNVNEVYDLETDSWTTRESMPTRVSMYASAVVGSKIYVMGGFAGAPIFWSNLNQIYDTETDSWSLGTPAPSSVTDGAGGATTGVNAPKRIYILGVSSYNGLGAPPIFNQVYDPKNDSWTAAATPVNRLNFDVAVINDTLYAIGGHIHDVLGFIGPSALNEHYTPIGYGTVPPVVSVVSPDNEAYNASSVDLAFAVNKPASWMGYSLDGQDNVTVTGNTTLTGLSNDLHNITVYARDEFENMGASKTISFSVEVPEPFPAMPVAVASAATIAVAGAVLLVYFKKRKR
jgi:N-acetylneuraminic acid mutarotase